MLEKKFERDEIFKQQYVEFMQEYESLGHMRLATEEPEPGEFVYHIPHHGVISSGKFRVVFDASFYNRQRNIFEQCANDRRKITEGFV